MAPTSLGYYTVSDQVESHFKKKEIQCYSKVSVSLPLYNSIVAKIQMTCNEKRAMNRQRGIANL